MRQPIFFVIGATNAGKSTFLQAVREAYPDCGLVEVGKWLRAKYAPGHFSGQGAPQSTAAEAWSLLVDGVTRAHDRPFVLVDGQPRDLNQVAGLAQFSDSNYNHCFIHLHATAEERWRRAQARDSSNPAALELARSRVTGDMAVLYDVTSRLQVQYKTALHTLNTEEPGYVPLAEFRRVAWQTSPLHFSRP